MITPIRYIDMSKDTYKKVCKIARRVSPVHEGKPFRTNLADSNVYGRYICPTYTLSFSRPFTYDKKNNCYVETVWYNTFRKMTIEKNEWKSAELTKMLTSMQAQTLRYTPFVQKLTHGLYEPTQLMVNLVAEIEACLAGELVRYEIEPGKFTEPKPYSFIDDLAKVESAKFTERIVKDANEKFLDGVTNAKKAADMSFVKKMVKWLDDHNLLWEAAGFSDNIIENMKNEEFQGFCAFIESLDK